MGFTIRTFDGKIAEDKEKKTPEIKFKYDRIVTKYMRAKEKDANGVDVVGENPSLAEIVAWAQSENIPTELNVNKDGDSLESVSLVSFLIDGINSHLNRTARAKAENSVDSIKEKFISMLMNKMGLTREAALEQLKNM